MQLYTNRVRRRFREGGGICVFSLSNVKPAVYQFFAWISK